MSFSVEHGAFSYGKNTLVLDDVSLSAEPGDIVAILGPNGAGKTTFLRCAMGFLKWTRGASRLDGRDIAELSPRELWRSIAYVPQAKGKALSLSVREMVLLGRGGRFGLFSQPGREDIEIAERVMDRLALGGLAERSCAKLSGGELQMTLIARALAAQPEILILDEPESNLDFKNQLLVLDAMSALAASGMSCIFNTHYPAHAIQRANKALLLDRVHGSLFGDASRVITEGNIERAFGVKTVISEVETPVNITSDVIPVMLSDGFCTEEDAPDERRTLAIVSVIFTDLQYAAAINALLHEYSEHLIGRMGMSYSDGRVHMINVNMDAPAYTIRALSHRLGMLPGISVKATFAKMQTEGGAK